MSDSLSREDVHELKCAVGRLADETQALRQTIDDLRTEVEHAVRNALPEIRYGRRAVDHALIPESIACANCDCDSPDSLAAALEEGWTELSRDDGISSNYLGVCPACQEEELAELRRVQQREMPQQGTLF